MKCFFNFDPAKDHAKQIAARLPKISEWLDASFWQVGPVDMDILPDKNDKILVNTLNPSLCDNDEVFVKVKNRIFIVDVVPDTTLPNPKQTVLILYVDLDFTEMNIKPEWQIENEKKMEQFRKEEEERKNRRFFGLFSKN